MFKKLWLGSNISLQYCKILVLLVLFAFNKAESNICQDNKPCQGRGGCFIIEETSQPSFLATYCVCARGYSGRWCQFQDGINSDSEERKQLNGRPGSPKILSHLSTNINGRSYNLTWEKPSKTAVTSVIYYALRYRIVGESKWKNVNEILARTTQTIYSNVFESLQWDVKYEVEIYAGSSQGVGRPATGIIHGPKIEYPEIVPLKEEITVVEDDRFFLSCDVRGEPRPTVSWTLNGKTISQGQGRNIFFKREHLRVNSANAEVQGVYRCVANNTWGTVMSRRIQVNVLARVKFLFLLDPHTSKPITMYVEIGKPAIFRCYPHSPKLIPGAFYKWGNRYKNSSEDFYIKTSERVWITTEGALVFSVFKQEDVDLFNKKGIRCIIEQKTLSGWTAQEVMSNVFRVAVEKHSRKQARRWFVFKDKPPKTITLLRDESLELHCSAISNSRGNIVIEWGIDTGKTKRFPNGINVTSFGRVLKYNNVQKSDSGKITCKAFKLNEPGSDTSDVITTITILKVLDRPEDVYESLPRKISVYSSSTLHLGPHYSDIPASWYFNGKRLTNKKPYLKLSSKHFRSTTINSGFVQADVIFGKISYTASVYVQFIDEDIIEETIPARSGIQLHCVPPATYSLPDIILEFAPSCGSNVVNNTIIVTQETAWRHDICSCKAEGYSYSVERKFDLEFDGAMFSSEGRWVWSQWSPWSDCPNTQGLCGQNLFSSRHRSCYNPTPILDGEYCSGSNKQKQPCPFIPCRKKVPSFWAPWSIWSDCSNPCGPGTQSRRRMCIAPSEAPCPEGEWHETKKCVGSVCYTENWGEWSQWSKCSKSCGIGTRVRRRQCSGQRCLGRSKDHLRCHTPCKPSKKDEAKEIYSKGILYLPNAVALGTAIILIVLAISMAIHNCRKKSLKKSNHKRLLQDLFKKPDLDVERQPLLETDTRPPPAKKRPPSREHKQENMATQNRTQPKNIARFKHKTDSKSKKRPASPGKESSSSLAPTTRPGNLPPPSPSLLAPSGGIAPASSAGGIVPPPPPVPIRGVGPSTPPPPPPPPPPGPKR